MLVNVKLTWTSTGCIGFQFSPILSVFYYLLIICSPAHRSSGIWKLIAIFFFSLWWLSFFAVVIIFSSQNITNYTAMSVFAIFYHLIFNLCSTPQAYETINWRATEEECPSRRDSIWVPVWRIQREGSAEVRRAEGGHCHSSTDCGHRLGFQLFLTT